MKSLAHLLQTNGILSLLLGTICVAMPQTVGAFLSDEHRLPVVALLFFGIGMNLFGLLLLWLARQITPTQTVNPQWIKALCVIDWLLAVWLFGMLWVTPYFSHTNGIAVTGLTAILFGWLGFNLWPKNKNHQP